MTVAQNIGFGLEMLGKSRPEIDERVTQMLRLVQGMLLLVVLPYPRQEG